MNPDTNRPSIVLGIILVILAVVILNALASQKPGCSTFINDQQAAAAGACDPTQ